MGRWRAIHSFIIHSTRIPCGLWQTLCWVLDVQDSDQDLVPPSKRPQSSGRQGVLQGEVLLPSDWGAGEGFLEECYVTECWKENRSLAHWGKGAFTGAGKISGKNKHSICSSGAKCFSRGIVPRRGTWQSTPIFLQGKIPRSRSLEGYSPWGCKESDTTEATGLWVWGEQSELSRNRTTKGPLN